MTNRSSPAVRLRGRRYPSYVVPHVEAVCAFDAVFPRRQPMPPWTKMLTDGPKGRQESLGMPGGCEAAHRALALAGRFVGVFGPIVEIAVLAMFDAGQYLSLGSPIAGQFIRNEYPGYILTAFQ